MLPDQTSGATHLLTSAGKNSTIYLVDRDDMGEFNPVDDSQIVQSLLLPRANFSAPVYANGRVYYAPISEKIRAYDLAGGELSATPTSQSSQVFGFPGAALTFSGNGASAGILWAIQRRGSSTAGVLRAYDAANLGTELYNSDQAGSEDTLGIASKYCIPAVANGRVYVGSLSELTVYGLLP
jgi:outer membrane protein assembly factor BamB